jgi:hypothetical protein
MLPPRRSELFYKGRPIRSPGALRLRRIIMITAGIGVAVVLAALLIFAADRMGRPFWDDAPPSVRRR